MSAADDARRLLEGVSQGLLAAALVGAGHLASRFIRPRPAKREDAGSPASEPAESPLQKEAPVMAKPNWFQKYIIGPVVAFFAGAAASDNPQVVAAKQTLATLGQEDLQAVNPLIDDLTQGIEGLVQTFASKAGALGLGLSIPVDMLIAAGASVAKQAIDHELGINPLPATTASAAGNTGSGSAS